MPMMDPKVQTQEWLEKAVIGLNLCPFAKVVHKKRQIRYVLSEATTSEDLTLQLISELNFLNRTDAQKVDTTLIIHPLVLNDFWDFNDFLGVADRTIVNLELCGVFQIASFHPQYQFAGTQPDDISNFTNRSPYPTLHLLRESSLTKAIDSYPGVEDIPGNNIKKLNDLGLDGWKRLRISTS